MITGMDEPRTTPTPATRTLSTGCICADTPPRPSLAVVLMLALEHLGAIPVMLESLRDPALGVAGGYATDGDLDGGTGEIPTPETLRARYASGLIPHASRNVRSPTLLWSCSGHSVAA